MRKKVAVYGTAIVIVSVLVNLVHAASHVGQGVTSLPRWQLVYIAVVTAFRVSAVLLLVLPGVGVLVGLWAARKLPRSATGVPRTRHADGVARPRPGSERNPG